MNPNQKSGNSKTFRRKKPVRKGDLRMKRIAHQEAQKVIAKKVESKRYDVSVTAFAIDDNAATSVFDLTAGIVRGAGDNNYIGDSIRPSHLRIRYAVEVADATNLIRVVVIQNKAGGIPLGGTVFQSVLNVNAPLSAFDSSFNETYRVLYDEFFVLAAVPADNQKITGDIRIKANKLRVINFTNTGALSAGGIYMVMISDSAAAAHPAGQFYSRLYFKDA